MKIVDRELAFNDQAFIFETVMRVRNTDVDAGQHLTLESLTILLSEARARFLYSKGIKTISAGYQGLIINDLKLTLISLVAVREPLLFEVGVELLSNDGGDLLIKVTRKDNGSTVAKARQHFVNYDYRLNKIIKLTSTVKKVLVQPSLEH